LRRHTSSRYILGDECDSGGIREAIGVEAASMTKLLIRLAVSAGAVLLAQWALDRWAPPDWQVIHVASWVTAVVFAVVLGLLNALVRPVLLLITCPLTLITLGLFTFVVNAVVFWLAAQLLSGSGVRVEGFTGALIGSLAVTICTSIADQYLEQ
jgi:putative membrane protein